MTATCTECHELKRALVNATSEHKQLMDRTRARHASPPERRRIQRLVSEIYLARQDLLDHQAACQEAVGG
jgi:hypothetical protein